jgi:undecaprenyl-diphosphatase
LLFFFAQYLAYVLVAIFLVLLIFSKKNSHEKIIFFLFAAVSIFLSRIIITEAIRYFYPVSRPFVDNAVNQLIFHETSGSFPSGHATFFFALAMAIMLATRWRTWGVVFFAGAILMGLARVIAGIHWPYDILGGAIIGIFSTLIVKKILDKLGVLS